MSWLALFVSLLALAMSGLFYWRFRRRQDRSVEQLSERVGNLLAEFNSVSSQKVDDLDRKTESTRRVIELANTKIKKLERLMDEAEHLRNSLRRAKKRESSGEQISGAKRELVLELAEDGYTAPQIARETGMKLGEISFILRLHESGNPGA